MMNTAARRRRGQLAGDANQQAASGAQYRAVADAPRQMKK
jgi:hypothetical protein